MFHYLNEEEGVFFEKLSERYSRKLWINVFLKCHKSERIICQSYPSEHMTLE